MIDAIAAMEMAVASFNAQYGDDAKLEDGEEFATVFNNCVVIIGRSEGDLSVKLLGGRPFYINENINVFEEETTCQK